MTIENIKLSECLNMVLKLHLITFIFLLSLSPFVISMQGGNVLLILGTGLILLHLHYFVLINKNLLPLSDIFKKMCNKI